MLRRLSLLALPWILITAAPVSAQDYAGTWTMATPNGGSITLTLQLDNSGRVSGSLSGNGNSFPLEGQRQGGGLVGQATIPGGALHFEASQSGGQLTMVLAELDQAGQPNAATRQELRFTRAGGAGNAMVSGGMGGGNSMGGGNPFGGVGAGGGGGDPYIGTFANGEVTFSITPGQGGYAGNLQVQGQSIPFTAQRTGDHLTGNLSSGGTTYIFEARLQGNTLSVLSDGQTVTLERAGVGGGAAPMMGTAPQNGMQNGVNSGGMGDGGGAGAGTQLGQLLLSSAWCSFSYSGTTDNTGTGRSSTSRVQFSADGTALQTNGGESYYNGNNGSVAGQSSGGQRYYWKVMGNSLQVSGDGAQWAPVNLSVSRNSNGYPIITADGTEYMQCN
jgi:hypothetical protein